MNENQTKFVLGMLITAGSMFLTGFLSVMPDFLGRDKQQAKAWQTDSGGAE